MSVPEGWHLCAVPEASFHHQMLSSTGSVYTAHPGGSRHFEIASAASADGKCQLQDERGSFQAVICTAACVHSGEVAASTSKLHHPCPSLFPHLHQEPDPQVVRARLQFFCRRPTWSWKRYVPIASFYGTDSNQSYPADTDCRSYRDLAIRHSRYIHNLF